MFYSYVVAGLFLTIFSFAARTLLHCFLLDEENGGGKDTPACLKSFVDYVDENDAEKDDDGNVIKPSSNKTGNEGGKAANME